MKRRNNSIDGFITRRPQRSSLNERSWQKTDTTIGHMRTDERENVEVHTGDSEEALKLQSGHDDGDIKQNISQSLQAIDNEAGREKTKKKKRSKKRRVAKIISLVIGLILLIGVGFLLYKAWQFGSKVFQGNILGIFQQQELKMDANGRSNVLILGSTDDMPGRDGANLTDSMMVLSVDQKKKNAYMFSIPRDLWVKYGQACFSGYEGKINAYFTCVDDGEDEAAEKKRMDGTRQLIGKLFDMDIQYVVHVNTVVIRDAVNAVGGVTVDVQSRDPRGVLDSTFDDKCRSVSGAERQRICPGGHYLDFKNGPNNMDGDKAMAFSQARGVTPPTYGLDRSNFDREKNQQLVLMALKDKATSTGTLTDIGKIVGLMDAMGNNLRTNIDAGEVRTIAKLASEIKPSDIHRLSFVSDEEGTSDLMVSFAAPGGQSAVRPAAGIYNYSQIQAYLNKNINATPVSSEDAAVMVLNGGGPTGVAQTEADKLAKLGMNIALVGNAPDGEYGKYKIYQIVPSGQKTATQQKLEELYGVKVTAGTPPFGLSVKADFVVVIGAQGE